MNNIVSRDQPVNESQIIIRYAINQIFKQLNRKFRTMAPRQAWKSVIWTKQIMYHFKFVLHRQSYGYLKPYECQLFIKKNPPLVRIPI